MKVCVKAPAKVNLLLNVVGRRADGYHLIDSIFQAIDWYERVTVEEAAPLSFHCTGGAPQDESNTALKAARLFAAYTGREACFRITVEKAVPMQAGLGGGSADAAGVLVALNRLTGADLSVETLCAIGEKIGADVPFCIRGGTALGTGIGTTLTPLKALTHGYFVIVKPACGVSTPEAYRLVDNATDAAHPSAMAFVSALEADDHAAMAALMQNTFEGALQLPDCLAAKQQLLAHGAKAACMSGSGSAVFGWFDDQRTAEACAKALAPSYTDTRLCRPCNGVIFD